METEECDRGHVRRPESLAGDSGDGNQLTIHDGLVYDVAIAAEYGASIRRGQDDGRGGTDRLRGGGRETTSERERQLQHLEVLQLTIAP